MGLLHKGDCVDDIRRQIHAVLLEPGNFLLNIVFQEIAKSFPETIGEEAKFPLKVLLVEDLVYPYAATGGLSAVRRADTALRRAHGVSTELDLLQTVNGRVKIEVDLASVRDKDALADALQSLRLEVIQLLPKAGDMENDGGSDQVEAAWVNQATGQKMEAGGLSIPKKTSLQTDTEINLLI